MNFTLDDVRPSFFDAFYSAHGSVSLFGNVYLTVLVVQEHSVTRALRTLLLVTQASKNFDKGFSVFRLFG